MHNLLINNTVLYMETYDVIPLILTAITGMVVVAVSIPVIIAVARSKNLVDLPDNGRKIHLIQIPSLGGVGLFIGLMFSYPLWQDSSTSTFFPYLVAALILLFAVGVKDDILVIAPMKKFYAQVIASAIVVIGGKMWIPNFDGFLGLHDGLPPVLAIIATIFAFVIIINAFNLIDGVDGLASYVTIIGATFFAAWFFINGFQHEALLAAALLGTLVGFLFYNNSPAKIFMGDTGSLTIGLVMAVLAFRLIGLNADAAVLPMKTPTVFAFSLMIMPMFDTFRIIIIRLIKRQHPLTADSRHIHHCLFGFGFAHRGTCAVMIIASLIIIAISYFINHLEIHLYGLLIMTMAFLTVPLALLYKRATIRLAGKQKSKVIPKNLSYKEAIQACINGNNDVSATIHREPVSGSPDQQHKE